MKEELELVAQFHRAFALPVAEKPQASLSENLGLLRGRLMQEELDEYKDAVAAEDLGEIADALGDILYHWCGTVLSHGLQDKMAAVFAEIHRSNMSKLDRNAKPLYREEGKVIKGPDYQPPALAPLLGLEPKK